MRPDGEKIRHSLHSKLTQAEIDFDMWLAMRSGRTDKDVVIMLKRRYGRFFMSAENAFFNSLVTILYSVFEKRRDTANLWSFRSSIEDVWGSEALEEVDEKYVEIKPIWKRICILRNEVVGHQSLRRTSDESHKIAGLTIADLRDMIKLSQELLFSMASKFQDVHVDFNLSGAESFERLIEDLRSNKSLKADAVNGAA